MRDRFRSRVLRTVRNSRKDELPSSSTAAKRKRDALRLLESTDGIERNSAIYIKLPAVIKSYPRRDEFILDSLSEADVIEHVKKDGGIEVNFVDYPHHNSTLLKLKEIRAMQIFVPHLRGDQRPASCRGGGGASTRGQAASWRRAKGIASTAVGSGEEEEDQ